MNLPSNKSMKVDDVKLLLSTLSLQEIYNSYKSIIDQIFSTDSSNTYWDMISRSKNKVDYDKILEFLSPNGALVELILKRLTTDKSVIYYEFPVQRLSPHTQSLIANNQAPIFISSKLSSKSHPMQSNVLILNAFEYFVFSFVGHIYQRDVSKRINWDGSTDSIYCQLVLRYFDLFLFESADSSLLMQLALQHRSKAAAQSLTRVGFVFPQQHYPASPQQQYQQQQQLYQQRLSESKAIDAIAASEQLYHTDTLLNAVAEFWLNSAIDQSPLASPTPSQLPVITVDHVCLVRVFLKRCYRFCFTRRLAASSLSPDCQLAFDFLDKLTVYRQQLVPRFFLSKILRYLHECFRDWPADLSFKIVMETWLSAVQPWRYVDATVANGVVSGSVHSHEWAAAFVSDNYDLYALLLLQFTRRLQRMDLAVARNSQMLFRVAKVLGQTQIARCMVEAREHRLRSHTDSLWADISAQMQSVFHEIGAVIDRLEETERRSSASWWHVIWDSINTDALSANSPKRVILYLTQSRSLLSNLLGIEYDPDSSRCVVASRDDYSQHKNSQPEHVITDRGAQLTNFGRFQVVHKLCSLNAASNIDYYQRPVCTYEFGPLVQLCRRTSTFFCSQFADQMRQACCRPDFLGRLSRCILIGEQHRPMTVANQRTESSTATGAESVHMDDEPGRQLERWVDTHTFQLRMRFLATKAFLFWLLVAYLVLHFVFGISPFSVLLGGVVLYLLGMASYVALVGFE